MKLNNQIRNDIVSKLIAHRFDAEGAALDKEEYSLAEAVMTRAMGGEEELIKFDRLPAKWFNTSGHIGVRAGGLDTFLNFCNDRPVPCFINNRSISCVIDADDPLADLIRDYDARSKDLRRRKREARMAAEGAISSVTTTERLIKIWPEIAPFVPTEAKVGPVALRTAELNALLGLPVDDPA